ncbi:hypothetical protein F2P56_012648 [Juglans regia]|uniref:Uncharacterized protein LOC109016918 n=2 Tax=Juglans regia TaxID=51240 RepID=A0A2I4HF79_JUGRE|nr:uncharacterized protein LOC109016918 [Juglans regia]KAF5468503.1 hypothetical protein F2P56_012648 [Juglans regia]
MPQSITDVSLPYFLHFGDHPSSLLVSTPLTYDSHLTWKRAMKMALNAKKKLGFINGSLTKPTDPLTNARLWDCCNNMVLSWLLNSVDKSLVSSLIYHQNARVVWIDLEARFSQSNNSKNFKLKRDITTLRQDSMSISNYYTIIISYWDELNMLQSIPP